MRSLNMVLGIAAIFLLLITHYNFAQDLGSWNIVNIKYNLDNRWSVFGKAQLRALKFYNDFHYYEYKGGFNYKMH